MKNMPQNKIEELLIEQLEKECFRFRTEEIEILLNECNYEKDGFFKLYNYIIDNKITNRDLVIMFCMKLSKCDNQIVIIEDSDNKEMQNLLLEELKKCSLSNEDISGIMQKVWRYNADIGKLYNYIVDYNVTDKDEIIKYVTSLCELGSERNILEENDYDTE